ncbi:MAG TPA: hypothetical protein VFU31_14850 [Candidatus Binatia bacterium]|nr:hypothetical protein [Candidatus Binatia bacterium]
MFAWGTSSVVGVFPQDLHVKSLMAWQLLKFNHTTKFLLLAKP